MKTLPPLNLTCSLLVKNHRSSFSLQMSTFVMLGMWFPSRDRWVSLLNEHTSCGKLTSSVYPNHSDLKFFK